MTNSNPPDIYFHENDVRAIILCKVPENEDTDFHLFTQYEIDTIMQAKDFKLQQSRICAYKRLKIYLQQKDQKLQFCEIIRHASGQPYLQNRTVSISFSHKDNFVLIGIAYGAARIAVDLEKIIPTEKVDLFYENIASDFEKETFENRSTTLSKRMYTTRLWCWKECLFKLIGQEDYYKKGYDIHYLDDCCSAKLVPKMTSSNLNLNYQSVDFQMMQLEDYVLASAISI